METCQRFHKNIEDSDFNKSVLNVEQILFIKLHFFKLCKTHFIRVKFFFPNSLSISHNPFNDYIPKIKDETCIICLY